MPTGTATIDFGVIGSPAPEASVAVTGQGGILTSSRVEAWVRIETTTEHDADEVQGEEIRAAARDLIAGTGFTIYAQPDSGVTYGTFKIDWVWT